MARQYRVGEVAALTGVTVRTLHHYDRIGLLRPSAYSDGRQRRYAEPDLLRLQQILTLRYLGFSLRQIAELLDRADFDLTASLRIQRAALRDRISALEQTETALDALLAGREATGCWDWSLVVGAAAAAQGGLAQEQEQKGATMDKYYTEEQMRQFAEVGQRATPDERRAIEQEWLDVLRDIRANRDLAPESADARALADRWQAIHERTLALYRGYPELLDAIAAGYQQNRFAAMEGAPTPEAVAFVARVNAAR